MLERKAEIDKQIEEEAKKHDEMFSRFNRLSRGNFIERLAARSLANGGLRDSQIKLDALYEQQAAIAREIFRLRYGQRRRRKKKIGRERHRG